MLAFTSRLQTATEGGAVDRVDPPDRLPLSWRALLVAALLSLAAGLAISSVLVGRLTTSVGPATTRASHRGLSSLPLVAQGQISAALGADRRAYRVLSTADGFKATNPEQRLRAEFSRSGVIVSSPGSRVGLALRAVGYGSTLTPVSEVTPTARANRVSYAHSAITEWYANGPLGLEQGFTIPRPLSAHQAGPLALAMALSGGAHVSLAAGGTSLTLARAGKSSLRYGSLSVTDAAGRTLHSRLGLGQGRLLITVDTRGASYPVRIDPFIQQSEKLTASGEIGGAFLGQAVALSSDGNTALIGGPQDNSYAGAAWVFTRSGETWTQQAKLTGTGSVGFSTQFGSKVALSSDGNTALIGGFGDNNFTGAVWVFTRSGSTWTQQGGKLTGSGEIGSGDFGRGLALSTDGNTALIGGPGDNSSVGSVWVFTRAGSTWIQQGGKLLGSGATGQKGFGESVALSSNGDTALIGSPWSEGCCAPGIGAARVFTRSGKAWTQQGEKLTGSGEIGKAGFGVSAALSADGNTALIGGSYDNNVPLGSYLGAAWVFTRSGSTWTQQGEKLTATGGAYFGASVALAGAGNTALIGSPLYEGDPEHNGTGVGAAWVFTRPAAVWTQQQKLQGGGEVGYARFGGSVALSSDDSTALIGGPQDSQQGSEAPGAAWAFTALASVTSVTPDFGPQAGGSTVTITGTKFDGAAAVTFGSQSAASFTVESDTSITAVSPPGSGTVDVTVTTAEGPTPITPADHFTYGPLVTNVSSNTGPASGGTSVTITGGDLANATAVSFGSTNATSFTIESDTSITAVSPPGAGTVDVTVTTPEGISPTGAADQFSYIPAPTVTLLSPNAGSESGGTTVSISGGNFGGTTTVTFGSTPATSFKVNSATSITAVSPAGTGTVEVIVTTPGGTSEASTADQFRYVAGPEYGRCLKVAKGTGLFESGTCTKPGGAKTYEWYPAVGGAKPLVKARFTAAIKPLTEAKLYTVGKHVISCTGETGTGEYTSAKAVGNVAITLTGCHLEALGSCQSLEAVAGEVVLNALEGKLGVIATSLEGPMKNKIGTDLRPASGEIVAAFACGSKPVLVMGAVIAEVPRNSMKLAATLKFVASSKGLQKPTRFEGGEEDVLLTKLGEGAFEQTGLKLTMVQTNEEKVEVNSVV